MSVQALLHLSVLGILSRLITPGEFGVVGIAMIFVKLSELLADGGISAALVQRRVLTKTHLEVAFTLTLASSIIIAYGMWLAAPLCAAFFETAQLTAVIRALCCSVLLSGLGLVANASLWRSLRFRAMAFIDMLSYLVGFGLVGISAALDGYGVWSLVWAVVIQCAVKSALVIATVRHSMRLSLKRPAVAEILAFGGAMVLNKLFNYTASRGDYVIIGRLLGVGELGLYERAYRLMEMPATYVAGVVNKVAFPLMSRVQDQRERLTRMYLQGMQLLGLIYLPVSGLLIILAPDFIRVLFGQSWLDAVAPFQILCVGLAFRASYKVNDALTRASGAVYSAAWRTGVYAIAIIVCALIGQRWGIAGVAVGVVVAVGIRFAISAQLAVKLLGLKWHQLFAPQTAGLLAAGALSGAVLLAGAISGLFGWGTVLELGTQLVAAGIGLAAAAFVLPAAWLGAEFFVMVRLCRRLIPGAKPVLDLLLARERESRTHAMAGR